MSWLAETYCWEMMKSTCFLNIPNSKYIKDIRLIRSMHYNKNESANTEEVGIQIVVTVITALILFKGSNSW